VRERVDVRNVSFQCSVVDRIVPATTAADRAAAAELLGLDDRAVVVAEPFRQWVIEDRFAGPRPAWERAGAELVADAAPYELLKLRVLNGSHSLLAYVGELAGARTVDEAVRHPEVAGAVRRLVEEDVAPTLPAGLDLPAYRAAWTSASPTRAWPTGSSRSPPTARRSCRSGSSRWRASGSRRARSRAGWRWRSPPGRST
jgi:mannitol-1-phosphate/altronate dehydrogenase